MDNETANFPAKQCELPPANTLSERVKQNRVCTALGVKAFSGIEIVGVAQIAGYDAFFIDLEHSQFTLHASSHLCRVANISGLSPFVRIPHECGNGFVQRVLDADAKGIIAPHIRNAEDARKIVDMVKYPPIGHRSINPSLLEDGNGKCLTPDMARATLRAADAVVFIQIETTKALENLDSIAAEPSVDVLLIGSMDMSLELGILGDWDHELYQNVLINVSAAAKRHGKQWGVSGLFGRPDLWKHIVQKLGARFIVGALDLGLLTGAATANCTMLRGASDEQAIEESGKAS